MSVVKIIIFLLTLTFLVITKKRKTDTYLFRNLIVGLSMLSAFYILCIIFFTPFSIVNMLFMAGCVIVICNLGEWENIFKYGTPLFILAILAYRLIFFI